MGNPRTFLSTTRFLTQAAALVAGCWCFLYSRNSVTVVHAFSPLSCTTPTVSLVRRIHRAPKNTLLLPPMSSSLSLSSQTIQDMEPIAAGVVVDVVLPLEESPSREMVSAVTHQDSTLKTREQQHKQQQVSWKDDGFVFGLNGSGLQRPQGRKSQIVVEGDSLETKPYQQAMVALTFAGHAWFLSQAWAAIVATSSSGGGDGAILLGVGQALLLTVASWILADFGSGVLHWSVDNYGNGKTPVMGSIIAAFQGHHSAPWTITERGFCNNVHKLCIPFGVVTMAIIQFLAGGPGLVTWFFTTFCIFEILSQEFHKWSHQLPSETPRFVHWLQELGLTIGRTPHALHHMAPYEGNYCIISGICNKALDQSGFFRRLERFIYSLNGVEPNAWKLDPELREKTLRGDYSLLA